jgi:hypothetical protein
VEERTRVKSQANYTGLRAMRDGASVPTNTAIDNT